MLDLGGVVEGGQLEAGFTASAMGGDSGGRRRVGGGRSGIGGLGGGGEREAQHQRGGDAEAVEEGTGTHEVSLRGWGRVVGGVRGWETGLPIAGPNDAARTVCLIQAREYHPGFIDRDYTAQSWEPMLTSPWGSWIRAGVQKR